MNEITEEEVVKDEPVVNIIAEEEVVKDEPVVNIIAEEEVVKEEPAVNEITEEGRGLRGSKRSSFSLRNNCLSLNIFFH